MFRKLCKQQVCDYIEQTISQEKCQYHFRENISAFGSKRASLLEPQSKTDQIAAFTKFLGFLEAL